MSNPAEKNNQNITLTKKNLILLIVGIILAVCIICGAVFAVIQTFRADNPTEPTTPTVDLAAMSELYRNTVAITVGDHQLNSVEVNYYFVETVNNFVNQYSYYISYFMDVSKPLNEQKCTLDESMTWAEYFMDIAQSSMKSTYMLCDLAAKDAYTLSETELEYLEQMKSAIEQYATYYGYESANAYLIDIFGYGADMDSYLEYYKRAMLADSYYANYAENIQYDDATLREYESKEPHMYSYYSYATYYLPCSKFLTGGAEDSEGTMTYTDEQKQAAIQAATEAANALLGSTCADMDAFKALILGMDINSDLESVSPKEYTDLFFNKTDEMFQDWFLEETRSVGQIAVIPHRSSVDEGEVIEGYYILWFAEENSNEFAMKDVRHLLVLFKNADGKTYSDGITSFTDDQKATAKDTADALLAQWLAGEATEDSFATLVSLKTEDDGSKANGGLYTNIYPGQMVANFENWCYDEARVHGDYDIIETEYGYHIMFFVGNTEMTYRDYIITNVMRTEDLEKWHDGLLEAAILTEVNLEHCKLDMVLSG